MPRQAALNLTTLGSAPFETKLYAAATAGFAAVGLSRDEAERLDEEGAQELRLSDLALSDIMALADWMSPDPTSRTVGMARAESTFELASRLDCSIVIAWPSPGPSEPVAAAEAFAELCRLAHPFHVRVGLEFLGHCESVPDLASAWEIVELSEAHNGGLVIDTFHFYQGRSALEMIEPVAPDKILLVQVSDAADIPHHHLRDRHRVYPGSGAIPLESLLGAIRAKGYSGHYSLELPNERYWQEDPVLVAREGMRSLRRLEIT